MRSSRFAPDPLDPGPAGFAHRGFHHGPAFPENSLSSFAAAIEIGAGIECDLRLTLDDRIVVFHDKDARRLCASPLVIGQSRLEELSGLTVGDQSIPTLESLLSLVRGRVPLLLEVKVERDLLRWMPALQRALAGYEGRFAVMSFDPRISRLLKSSIPKIRRGYLVHAALPPLRRRLYRRLADPHFLALERTLIDQPWVSSARRRMPIYAWTIRDRSERMQAEVHADALIWEADGRPRI